MITDSAAIITFLADRHGELTFPAGSVQRAKQDALLHRVNDEIDAVYGPQPDIVSSCPRRNGARRERKPEIGIRAIIGSPDGTNRRPLFDGGHDDHSDIILVHCGGWAYNAKFPLENEAFKAYKTPART